MSQNRIAQHVETPAAPAAMPTLPPGFVYCPNPHAAPASQSMNAASFMHQAAYQQALQEARDKAWRAFLDKALFSVWN
jgi:hypothetical protein